jgi:Stress responsive A/B Barrel Domain
MISHVVLLKPRADLTVAVRRAMVEALKTAARDIPSVRAVRVGRRILCGAGYESTTLDTADFLLILDFDDIAGLQAYLHHPAHVALGAHFATSLSSALAYDFETGGVDRLDEFA